MTIYLTRDISKYEGIEVWPPLSTVWCPEHQANLATHILEKEKIVCWSEVFINQIGALIQEGKLDRTQITVLVDGWDKPSHYDEKGILEDFPWGWFLPQIY